MTLTGREITVPTRENYSDRRRRRPDKPITNAQTPRMSMTADDGSGAEMNAGIGDRPDAWAAPALRPAHMRIDSNFMSSSLPDEPATPNKLATQKRLVSTIEAVSISAVGVSRSRYRLLMVLALVSSGMLVAQEVRFTEVKLPAHFDPFAVDVKDQYAAAAVAACAEAKPRGFIGYRWRHPAVASGLRMLSGESPGKQVYIAFLKSKYGYQIKQVNADYGTDAQSFTELLDAPLARPDGPYDAEFDSGVRSEMTARILEALRKCDSGHADGGIRWLLEFALGR